jgi:protein-disulfide isomerase
VSEQQSKRERREAARQARIDAEAAAVATARRNRRLRMLGIVLAGAVVLVVIAIVVSSGGSSSKTTPPPPQKGELVSGQNASAALLGGIPQHGIELGQPSAPLTLVQFEDLQCPFCRAYTVDEFPAIVRDYVRTGKLKIEFRNFTFIGNDSVTAGQYASAAGKQNKLWNFVDLFYLNQGQENSGYVTQSFLSRLLKAVPGLDATKAHADALAPDAVTGMKQANTLASQKGIDSTPSFLLGKTGGTLQRFPSDPNAGTPSVAQFEAAFKRLLGQ